MDDAYIILYCDNCKESIKKLLVCNKCGGKLGLIGLIVRSSKFLNKVERKEIFQYFEGLRDEEM